MDHPSIARVIDAGATQNGRPYFVMELVRGTKITDYCNDHNVTMAGRLELFIQVCEAVQHAHQKGIIHRDIKPPNILVTTSVTGAALPKVIDFGIAKATNGVRLTDKTLFTEVEMLIGTPSYMSPEQATLGGVDVDTRTDIFSLGVLLYELLTGKTPIEIRDLPKAGIEEVCRLIQTREASAPSTRLKAMPAPELNKISKCQQATPAQIIRSVTGDLDWIVMKALEKERGRRYATANEFAMDVRRYLNSEAVLARPPSSLYKFQKLVSRNKLLFSAVGLVVLFCVAGLTVTTWSLSKERRARQDADISRRNAEVNAQNARAEAEHSRQVTELMEGIFHGVGPSVAKGRDTTILREILDAAAGRMKKELTNQPAVEAEMWRTMGVIYREIGELEKAKSMSLEALEIYRKMGTTNDEKTAQVLFDLGTARLIGGTEIPQARNEISESLRIRTKLFGSNNMDVVQTAALLGWTYIYLGSNDPALLLESNALRTGHLLMPGPSDHLVNAELGLAKISMDMGKNSEAEAVYRTALREQIQIHGEEDLGVAVVMRSLGTILEKEGNLAEAETLYNRCAEIRRKDLGTTNIEYWTARELLGVVYQKEEKFSQAAAVYRELITNRVGRLGGRENTLMGEVANLAWHLDVLGKSSEAESLQAEFQSEHPDLAESLLEKEVKQLEKESDQLAQHGHLHEAEALATVGAKMKPQNADTYHTLVPLLAMSGDHRGYEDLCGQIVKVYSGTTNFYTADRMAKDCLILPRPGADLQPVAAMANLAVSAGEKTPGYNLFIVCKALAEYRQEHWSMAAEWADRASEGAFPYSKADGYAILAMSQWHMNRLNEARESLANCRDEVKAALPELDSPNLGQDWRDCIIAHLLLGEATQLIEFDHTVGRK
jgi:serine/threonine protein kinase